MKVTRANVEEYAKQKGLEPIQIDGIPEGFAWKSGDIKIGKINNKGIIIAFVPLAYTSENLPLGVHANYGNVEELLNKYNQEAKRWHTKK